MTMVNLREFYEKDGKSLPGKAGINLPLEQFRTFLSLLPQVLDELETKGEKIEPPIFGTGNGSKIAKGEDDDEDDREEQAKPKKSNFEATSDEDEDE
jgi:hypothetical protein